MQAPVTPSTSPGAALAADLRLPRPGAMTAVVGIDAEGGIVAWSREAELVFGWPAEDIVGHNVAATIVPARYRAAHEAGLARAVAAGGVAQLGRVLEIEARRADGTEFPAELFIASARDPGGEAHFIAFVRDLSERRRLEQVHAAQYRVTRVLVQSATLEDAGPRVLAAIGENLGWPVGGLWVVGVPATLLQPQAVWLQPGVDAEDFVAGTLAQSFVRGEGVPGRVWERGAPMAFPDAVAFPILSGDAVIGVVEFFTGGAHPPDAVVLATMSDLGRQLGEFVEHRLAEQLLERRVHELEVLQQAALALSASLDLDVVLDAVARTAAEALSAPRATVLRRDGDELVIAGEYDETGIVTRGGRLPIADLPGADAVLRGEDRSEPLDDVGPTLQQITQRTRVTAAAMAPIWSGTDAFGILAMLSRRPRDLDDSEMRLLLGIANLAGLAVGNAESFRLEREHGRKMAALDTAKAQFLNLASHELRGPLTVLRGYISMIGEGSLGPLPERMARVLPLLDAKLEQMGQLVDQMLETARLEDSRLQLDICIVDLRDVVRAAVNAYQAWAQPGQRIVAELTDHPVSVEADASRLETAVRNLVDNALKYSPGGGDVVTTLSTDDGRAVVRVRDHGLGIAAADMDKLFTRFGRIVSSENSHIPGTGLGLYLAREIVRMQGGDIIAESTPGEGSTFTLWLPRRNEV